MGSFGCRWYAKRFLHPDIMEPYEYIFIWDEDLDVTHFDAEKYVLTPSPHLYTQEFMSFWLDSELS